MKSPRQWAWSDAPIIAAPPALRAAADRSFGLSRWTYRWALSRCRDMRGPLVHVASCEGSSLVAWTGRGSPSVIMSIPDPAERATRRIEAGLFVSKALGSLRLPRRPRPLLPPPLLRLPPG